MKPVYVSGDDRWFFVFGRWILTVLKVVVISVLLLTVLGASLLFKKYYPTIEQWFRESNEVAASSTPDDFRKEETSYAYGADGNLLLKLKADKDVVYVEYDDLPECVRNAAVAIEDKRFYKHNGVDWLSTAKAGLLLLKNNGEVKRGGSTITQQLARNAYLTFTVSYERKVREIFLALALEQKYSKEQILEFYLNSINYGNGYYGIGAAAKGYFSKSVSDLTISEAAFLCAIPNNPTVYNPLKNFENTMSRRNVILREMYSQGMISSDQYTVALTSKVTILPCESAQYGYAASYALDCAVTEFMKLDGFSFEYSWESGEQYSIYCSRYEEAYEEALYELRTGGYKVYTTINDQLQDSLQEVLDDGLSDFTSVNDSGEFVMQGALTVLDNESGKVVACIGGRTSNNETVLGLNRAFQSYRQPGSTIKPLVVYTPAIEYGYNANSMVEDTPVENGPQNSDGRYSGRITLRQAVEKSKNVVAWKLFDEITPTIGLGKLSDMQFSKVVPSDYGLAASLGGMTYGVTTVEMAGGYAAIANDGIWSKPTCIDKIEDSSGHIVSTSPEEKRVYSELAAHSMTDILEGVSKHGTASGLKLKNGAEFACKTGTTNGNKTAWFCGFSKQYTVAVYVGTDDNSTVSNKLYGSTYPAKVWKGTMDILLSDEVSEPLLNAAEKEAVARNCEVKAEEPIEQDVPEKQTEEVVIQGEIATPEGAAVEQTAPEETVIQGETTVVPAEPVPSEEPTVQEEIPENPTVQEVPEDPTTQEVPEDSGGQEMEHFEENYE